MTISPSARKLCDVNSVELVEAKFIQPAGQATAPYIPQPPVGNRPLLIVEGETRVLAVLDTGAEVDAIGITGCAQWHSAGSRELFPAVSTAVKAATSVVVVLDGDWATNPDVLRQLLQLLQAVRQARPGVDLKVGVPGEGKAGLDDYLAEVSAEQRRTRLLRFIERAGPADLDTAIDEMKDEHRAQQRRLESILT